MMACVRARPSHWHAASDLVDRVAGESRVAPEVRPIEVSGQAAARRAAFSRVADRQGQRQRRRAGGEDRTDYGLSCRVYVGENGVSGCPDPGWLREALASG
jgi:hypothetical protein